MEGTKKKVLFLEDEPTIREVLTEYMLLSGYEVTAADRGDGAIELLDRQKFAVGFGIVGVERPKVSGLIIYN